MINFKELEKFATSGKVATIVVLVDGKELFALSFQMDTLAYKEILEDAKHIEKVAISDKAVVSAEVKKAETERKESLKAKKGAKTTPAAKIEPEPLDKGGDGIDDDDNDGDFGNDDDVNEDIETGPKESLPKIEPVKEEKSKPMTRAEIMAEEEHANAQESFNSATTIGAKEPAKQVDLFANAEAKANEHSGSKSAEHDGGPDSANKPIKPTISEEW